MESLKINAVFEGGGIKAIGIAGAVSIAEQKGFQFHQVAGTSAGSIVASLIAAGYQGSELNQIIMNTPFKTFMKKTWIMDIPLIGPGIKLIVTKGLYSADALELWIKKLLDQKGIRTFGDLAPNKLRIIASDISRGKLLVLPEDADTLGMDPKKLEVSKAVRMSSSIPYFFEPVMIRIPEKARNNTEPSQDIYIVDGGLLSNFPLWLFDKANDPNPSTMTPTIGFRLVGSQLPAPHHIGGPITMLDALFSTMMGAHDERFIEKHNEFRTIKIPTLNIKTTQFEISQEESKELFESGQKAAARFFERWTLYGYVEQIRKHVR